MTHRFSQIRLFSLMALVFASVDTLPSRAVDIPGVPEASGYTLVYNLNIPTSADFTSPTSIPYTTNNSASTPYFDRIAYYMKLGNEWVYTSMDAFTDDATKIGVPVLGTDAVWQQNVANMNVFASSNSGVVAGAGISTGNIEFWPYDYWQNNAAQVPLAADTLLDYGDVNRGPSNAPYEAVSGYGAMQIHNYGARQTIMAYNGWGATATGNSDVGIGNNSTMQGTFYNQTQIHPDWSGAENAADYASRTLMVMVRPTASPAPFSLALPTGRSVRQRDDANQAAIRIAGARTNAGVTRIEARALVRDGSPGSDTGWVPVASSFTGNSFDGSLTLPGGWYDIEVRGTNAANQVVGSPWTVEKVGVGEVFITAGQSNSANHGFDPQGPADVRVVAYNPDISGWQTANDPQPVATTSWSPQDDWIGGSPWPILGDMIAADEGVPVGFYSVGWGGTTVGEWEPGAPATAAHPALYPRLEGAINTLESEGGFRAILWHQGEENNYRNTSQASYAASLQKIIAESRQDAGRSDLPWLVALASYTRIAGENPNIIAAQQQVIDSDPFVFQGPYTDVLQGHEWRPDGSHFNAAGLAEHARLWMEALEASVLAGDPAADFNGDGNVDAADLSRWSTAFAKTAVGDADEDGDTDGQDLLIWQRSLGVASAVGASGAVPEASTETQLLLCLAPLLSRWRIARTARP